MYMSDIISNFVLICILSIYFLFKMEDIREKIKYYVKDNKKLSLIVFLLDSRHLPTDDDLDFYTYLKHYNYPFIICMTKCDKLNMSLKSKINKNIKEKFGAEAAKETVFLTSINDKNSIFKLADYIKEKVGG